jgi:hypothetical protein
VSDPAQPQIRLMRIRLIRTAPPRDIGNRVSDVRHFALLVHATTSEAQPLRLFDHDVKLVFSGITLDHQ